MSLDEISPSVGKCNNKKRNKAIYSTFFVIECHSEFVWLRNAFLVSCQNNFLLLTKFVLFLVQSKCHSCAKLRHYFDIFMQCRSIYGVLIRVSSCISIYILLHLLQSCTSSHFLCHRIINQ